MGRANPQEVVGQVIFFLSKALKKNFKKALKYLKKTLHVFETKKHRLCNVIVSYPIWIVFNIDRYNTHWG